MGEAGAGLDYQLRQWFRAADENGSGDLDAAELQRALQSSDFHFSLYTTAMMIRTYDRSETGRLDFEGFTNLHGFILSVTESFHAFDTNRDGVLDPSETQRALSHYGFNLEEKCFLAVFRAFDPCRNHTLGLSDYVAMAAFLSRSRTVFSTYDPRTKGRIQLDFCQFVYATAHLR